MNHKLYAARWDCTEQGSSSSNGIALPSSSSSEQTPPDSAASSPEGVQRPLLLGPAVPQRVTFHEIVYPAAAAHKWCPTRACCQLMLLSFLPPSLGGNISVVCFQTTCYKLLSVGNLTVVGPCGPAQVQEDLAIVDCEGDHQDPSEIGKVRIFSFTFEASNYSSKQVFDLPARRLKEGLC